MTSDTNQTMEMNPNGPVGIRRVIVGAAIPAVTLATAVVPYVLYRDELPDRVATHFDASGTPDGSMTSQGLLIFSGLLLVMPGVLMLIGSAVRSNRMSRPFPPFMAGLGGFLAMLGSAIVAQTVLSQRGLNDWTEASNPGVGIAAAVVAASVAGVVAALLAKALPYNVDSPAFAADPGGEVPIMDITPGERVVFTETISPGWMLWLTAGFLAAAVVLAIFAVWWTAFILLLTAVPLLLFSAMRVQADQHSLTVRSALLGVRFAKVKTADLEQASVIDVEPMKWGGWGYRGSLKLAGTAAVVMRRGPGVHLKLTGDRVFVVTLDNPRAAAAVLNAGRNFDTNLGIRAPGI